MCIQNLKNLRHPEYNQQVTTATVWFIFIIFYIFQKTSVFLPFLDPTKKESRKKNERAIIFLKDDENKQD